MRTDVTPASTRPNFFVIGAAKAGTTSLCELLAGHPDVFVSTPKEPGYFSLPHKHARGEAWYASLFAPGAGRAAIGEGSTTYSQVGVYPETPGRIAAYAPDARIIYITRSPLERLESLWIQWRNQGRGIPASFARALRTEPAMIDSALYWTQISAYRALFPDERILVLFLEDLEADPRGVLRRCFEHLDVDPGVEVAGADDRRNVWSEGKLEDRLALEAMRRVPGYDRLRDALVPHSLRRALRGVFRRRITERPRWDPETRRWVIERIAGDVRRFLEHYGKPAGYWPLDPEADHAPARERGAAR